jgi:hypothetical protein
MNAIELIKSGETAMVIFTRGENFVLHDDGTGETGSWKVDPKRSVQKVILYNRDAVTGENKVYVAVPLALLETELEGRRVIQLGDVKPVGTTKNNWLKFKGTKQGAVNPVKYITAK